MILDIIACVWSVATCTCFQSKKKCCDPYQILWDCCVNQIGCCKREKTGGCFDETRMKYCILVCCNRCVIIDCCACCCGQAFGSPQGLIDAVTLRAEQKAAVSVLTSAQNVSTAPAQPQEMER